MASYVGRRTGVVGAECSFSSAVGSLVSRGEKWEPRNDPPPGSG